MPGMGYGVRDNMNKKGLGLHPSEPLSCNTWAECTNEHLNDHRKDFRDKRESIHLALPSQGMQTLEVGYRSWLTCLCGGSPNCRLYSLLN